MQNLIIILPNNLSFRYEKHKSEGKKLYNNGYLIYLRKATKNSDTYFKCCCKSQYKKNTEYQIDIKISLDGSIAGSHCECPSGNGSSAHCKHIAAALWAIVDLKYEKKIILHRTTTQKHKSFHQPKSKFFGGPIKDSTLRSNIKVRK